MPLHLENMGQWEAVNVTEAAGVGRSGKIHQPYLNKTKYEVIQEMKFLRSVIGINIFWLALSMLFDGVNTLFLPNTILNMTGEARAATILGIITFSGLFLGMLFQPVAGSLSDRTYYRWGRRGMIAVGTLLTIGTLFLLGTTSSIFILLIAFVSFQLAMSLSQSALQGFIPDLVPQDRRGTAAGVKGFMDLAGALIGFIVLAELLANGQKLTAIVTMVIVLVVTFLFTSLLVKEDRHRPVKPTERPSIVTVFRLSLEAHGTFLRLVLARFLFLFGIFAIGRFFLLFIAARLNLDAAEATVQAGSLLALLTLLSVLATIPAGWASDRYGRRTLMLIGALVSAIGVGMLIFADTGWQILLFGSLMSLGSAAFTAANWAYTVDIVPSEESGRFMGIANFGTAGAAAIVGLLGPVIDWANTNPSAGGYSILLTVAVVAFLSSTAIVLNIQSLDKTRIATLVN